MKKYNGKRQTYESTTWTFDGGSSSSSSSPSFGDLLPKAMDNFISGQHIICDQNNI